MARFHRHTRGEWSEPQAAWGHVRTRLALPRLLHTADWQIGKPFRWVEDQQKRIRLQQARIEAISRIAEHAQKQNADALLVAGDLFDSAAVPTATVMEVLEVMASIPCPVLVIPGNHDHGGAGGIWRRTDVQREMQQRCPGLQLLLERRPIKLPELVVLPCPLLRQHEGESPTAWLDALDWSSLPSDSSRVVLAHGTVQGFNGGDDHLEAGGGGRAESNRLRLGPGIEREVDYIALGDWHALHQVSERCWYSGTPEPDRFSRSSAEQRGQILQVDLKRQRPPQVTTLGTAGIQWHGLKMQLNSNTDLERLEHWLDQQVGRRVGKDLIRLELEGQLSLADHQAFAQRLEQLEPSLLHLRLRGEGIHRRPQAEELSELTDRRDGPLLSAVALQLLGELERSNDPEQVTLLETALCELHRLCERESGENPRAQKEAPCA